MLEIIDRELDLLRGPLFPQIYENLQRQYLVESYGIKEFLPIYIAVAQILPFTDKRYNPMPNFTEEALIYHSMRPQFRENRRELDAIPGDYVYRKVINSLQDEQINTVDDLAKYSIEQIFSFDWAGPTYTLRLVLSLDNYNLKPADIDFRF